jgi:hypothetical protein
MRTLVLTTLVLFSALTGAAFACGEETTCTLATPDGAAVAVYADPALPAHTELPNGREVVVLEEQEVGGKQWSKLGVESDGWGYLPNDMLICDAVEDANGPICTVTNPAGAAVTLFDEEITTTLGVIANGLRARPFQTVEKDGRSWRGVEYWPDDNVLGWVETALVKCVPAS